MRTLCDVCEAAPAQLFCAADEAALCLTCDEKVHGCNKLASRHVRLKLAEARKVPRCDICESAPAFFFCGVDGTSLCLQCDMEVHTGVKKTHERYLLMGQRVELMDQQRLRGEDLSAMAISEQVNADREVDVVELHPTFQHHHHHPVPNLFDRDDTKHSSEGDSERKATKVDNNGRSFPMSSEQNDRLQSSSLVEGLRFSSNAPAVAIAVGDLAKRTVDFSPVEGEFNHLQLSTFNLNMKPVDERPSAEGQSSGQDEEIARVVPYLGPTLHSTPMQEGS